MAGSGTVEDEGGDDDEVAESAGTSAKGEA